ncbi:MAG: sulfatase-like hydrolase/transferase [Planctomycetota bacterium]|jgi:choline-sulfatase
MSDKPNVIVVMCDQMRAFAAGCYGNEFCQTPNIDRLAAEGVRFEHAVSNNPVCTPARGTLVSGQYSRTWQGDLGNPLAPFGGLCAPEPVWERVHCKDPTLPEQFKAAGYDTALIGKWHVHPAPDLLGFDYRVYPRVNHRHTDQIFVDQLPPGERVEGFSVDYEAEKVAEYLKDHRDNPFFLFYSISPPHMPVADMPEKYLTMYDPADVPLRPNVFVDGEMYHDEDVFLIYLWDYLYYWYHLPENSVLPEGFDLRTLTALYYGATTWVDDMMGKLMAELESNGLADNTIVVFTSDHGDNLGSHHTWNKGLVMEESIRIPMIFWAPKLWQAGVNETQVAELMDIMPTLLDACGAQTPTSVQGDSLLPILTGQRTELDETDAFLETCSGFAGIRTPTHTYGMTLTGDGLRQIEDPDYCFYDNREDPYQTTNLIGTDAQADLAATLKQRVLDWHASTPWLQAES